MIRRGMLVKYYEWLPATTWPLFLAHDNDLPVKS